MKEKLIGDRKNGFLITKFDNYAICIQEFLNGKHYSTTTLSRKEANSLKEFLNEKL